MTKSKLQTIADGMRRSVSQHATGWTAATLPGGLELVLARQGGDIWRLALRRERVYPSDTEASILAEVFGVPDGIESARRSHLQGAHPKSARQVRWCVVEFIWREIPANAPAEAMLPAAPAGRYDVGATVT
jgi:hypothetical protein